MGKRRGRRDKVFYAHATIRHRRNTIPSLINDHGIVTSDHNQKADLIWDSFKHRIRVTEFEGMIFSLAELLTPTTSLSDLETNFSRDEIDSVISQLPNDKSLGPDGFNNDFIKIIGQSSEIISMILLIIFSKADYVSEALMPQILS